MTKIGTAPPADIVVNDGFMSTEHCQINVLAGGLHADRQRRRPTAATSTTARSQKHELVDNDMITLGKTNFKFKSIN